MSRNTIRPIRPIRPIRGRRRQRGVTLMEIMVYIAIGLLLIGGGGVVIAMALGSSKVGTDVTDLQSILTHVPTLHDPSGYGASGSDLIPQLKSNGGIPGDMTMSGSSLFNAYNGAVTVTSTGLGFTVTTSGLPADACQKEVTKLSLPGKYTVSINGGSAVSGIVTHQQAFTGCSSTSNSLSFTSAF